MAEVSMEQLPKRVRDAFEKAASAVERNNLDYAIEMLTGLLDREPQALEARRLLRAAQVRRFLAKGAPTSMRHTLASLSGMMAMMKINKLIKKSPVEALQAAERLMNSDPFNPSFYNLVAKTAQAADMPEVAVNALETAREVTPDDIELLRTMGALYKASDDTSKMRECFEHIQSLRPNDPRAIKDLKDAQAMDTMSKGRWTEATSFRDVMKDSDEARKLEQQARAMKTTGDLEALIDDQRAKIEREPQNVNFRRMLADLLARNNQYADALHALDEADKLTGGGDPQIDRTRTSIRTRQFDGDIEALRSCGDTAGAEAMEKKRDEYLFEDAAERVRRYPNDLQFKYEYGVMLFERGDFNEAIQQFQMASRNPQRRVRALWYLARCLVEKGQLDIAADQLERAASELMVMDATKKDVLYDLASVHERMGNNDKALEYYKEIYSSDIAFRDVAQKIEQFYKKS
ncbi:MAG: tetratricopeptide repeat protein [Kiritimatiellae bacterium]|nr:tetratricopeptide repeat protein [Kiritimatiellia bacterium]